MKLPPAWTWLVDEAIPTYVKSRYSPDERWRGKPFEDRDAQFFFRGVRELSELFTEERPKDLPSYFAHPKYRSAYLLYFLPLQAAKFSALFQLHAEAVDAALEHGRQQGVMQVLDLGAGPGTASIALLLDLLSRSTQAGAEALPPIELHWWDTQKAVLEDGKAIADELSSHFPKLRDKVKIILHAEPWWKAMNTKRSGQDSLILFGHVLNEKAARPHLLKSSTLSFQNEEDEDGDYEREESPSRGKVDPSVSAISALMEKCSGGGILAVEPASRGPAQHLSLIRNQLIDLGKVPKTPSSFWGPCPHAERCPLSVGRDWCHFSLPAEIPGKWFRKISIMLSTERNWLKFSYLWFTTEFARSRPLASNLRLVVSDPIRQPGERGGFVLTCEPEVPGRMQLRPGFEPHRGDIVPVGASLPRPGNLDEAGLERPSMPRPRIEPKSRNQIRTFTPKPKKAKPKKSD